MNRYQNVFNFNGLLGHRSQKLTLSRKVSLALRHVWWRHQWAIRMLVVLILQPFIMLCVICAKYISVTWLCSHGLESRSERRFGTRSKTWLGSWFELRAFTWATNAFPITIRICALRVIFCSYTQSARADWPMRLCMASARIFKMHTYESRSERALRSHGLESGFLGGSRSKTPFFFAFQNAFQKPDLKQLCVHMG